MITPSSQSVCHHDVGSFLILCCGFLSTAIMLRMDGFQGTSCVYAIGISRQIRLKHHAPSSKLIPLSWTGPFPVQNVSQAVALHTDHCQKAVQGKICLCLPPPFHHSCSLSVPTSVSAGINVIFFCAFVRLFLSFFLQSVFLFVLPCLFRMTLVKPGYFVYLQFWNGCCNARYNSWQPQNAFSFFALLYGWLLMIVFCFLIFCLLVLILRVYVQASCGYLESDLYCIAISLAFLARSLYLLYSPFPFAFHRFHGNVDGPAIDSLFTCCLAPFNIRGKKDCQNCLRRWCLCFCTLKHEDSKISEFPATTPEDVLGWCDISFWPPPQIPIRRLVSVFSFPLPQTPAAWKLKWVAHIWKSTRAKSWSVQLTFHFFLAPFSSFSAVFFFALGLPQSCCWGGVSRLYMRRCRNTWHWWWHLSI